MNKPLMKLRAMREVYALPPLSEAAEAIFADVLEGCRIDQIVDALDCWTRKANRFPAPVEILEVMRQRLRANAAAASQRSVERAPQLDRR